MPVPEDFYDFTFVFKNAVSPRQATFSIGGVPSDLSTPTAAEAAEDIRTFSVGSGAVFDGGQMIDDWTFLGVSCALGTASGDSIGQFFLSEVGTVSDATVPSNCALLVKKNTALGGRRQRGRMFVPPVHLNEGAVDAAGNISSSPLAVMQNLFDDWWDLWDSNDWVPILFHQGGGAPDPTPIGSFTVSSLIATQRRRMRS